MDFQRTILIMALSFTLLLMWQAWQKDYGPKPPVTEQSQPQTPHRAIPQSPAPAPSVPSASAPAAPASPALPSAQRVQVHTDTLYAEIDTKGGDLRRADLLKYPVSSKTPDVPETLLHDKGAGVYVAQSGLVPAAAGVTAPNHHAQFQAERTDYRMAPSAKTLEVPLYWHSDTGVEVTKIYVFHRGSYKVDLRYEIRNAGTGPWSGHLYRQFLRSAPSSKLHTPVHTYTGGVIYSPDEKYQKVPFDDMADKNLSRVVTGGWVAMSQHYFLGAWIPPNNLKEEFYSKAPGNNRYILGMLGPVTTVAPGQSATLGSELYIGPKLQDQLGALAPGLELTVDYGWLTVLAKPIFWLLERIHSLLGNWGWSIIVLTILIKGAFFKLSATSYKSMAQMRKMQPRMKSLKERFGDDKKALSDAMMKLYREEKINPLGGCLPIAVQIPVFIALYWVLIESVEMRQANFALWIHDLSSADPYFVLPILMGVTMLIQQRLNPSPMDPIQAKVMMVLPVVFTVFFAFFPAGLVLYWVTSNTLSIVQQWYITRKVVPAS